MARTGIPNIAAVVASLVAAKVAAIREAERIIRATASDVLTGVVIGTPEDTSVTIGDWQVALGAPPTSLINKPDPGGSAALASGKATFANAKIGSAIHIVNNQPHIDGLNAGRAVSKPSGWVEGAIDNATRRSR
jgi:hypothetical protein